MTVAAFAYFLVAPTLVYEPSYPRARAVRPRYIALKLAQATAALALAHAVFSQFVVPVLREDPWQAQGLWREKVPRPQGPSTAAGADGGAGEGAEDPAAAPLSAAAGAALAFLSAQARLAVPSLLVWLLMYVSVFHCLLNAQAEALRFADRQFSLDWWNATSLASFWRRWNAPVHEWCLRHVFLELQYYGGVPRELAVFATFFASAVAHELLFSVAFQTARPWFFLGMLAQLPLMAASRALRGRRRGNLLVWASLLFGQPLLELLYMREWLARHGDLFCIGEAHAQARAQAVQAGTQEARAQG